VADRKEASDALGQWKFDAIVTDVRMPRVTGMELVRALHESGQPYSGNYFRQRLGMTRKVGVVLRRQS